MLTEKRKFNSRNQGKKGGSQTHIPAKGEATREIAGKKKGKGEKS